MSFFSSKWTRILLLYNVSLAGPVPDFSIFLFITNLDLVISGSLPSVPNSPHKNYRKYINISGENKEVETLFSYRIYYIVHPKNWEGFLRGTRRMPFCSLFATCIYQRPYLSD